MPNYHEKVWPAPWLLIAAVLVIPASILVLAPISLIAGIVTAVILYGGCVVLWIVSAPVIDITETDLRVGRASIPLELTGTAVASSGSAAVLERGQRLDARAWLQLQGGVSGVVRIPVTDAADPTPYWLVSSRRGQQMAAAINGSRRPTVPVQDAD